MDSLLPSDPMSIDGYVIEGRLGSGGFGIVYAATSPDGLPVAVKVLRPELSDDVRLRERLAREAEALGRVEGERTAEIFEVVTDGDLVYLVMERVEGESLADQVNENGALSGPMLWFAAAGLVQALQEIHSAGIVHRDLKPSNVMYGPDGVKVLDFGISVVADETALTQTGAFVGTGAWMAPEMVLGNGVTEKTDVYALGLVLAFIALGRHPFGEGRADALMYRIVNTDPDLEGIPTPFIDAVLMCLQRDPDDRPSLDELAGFFGSNGEQQLSATSIVGSDAGGTRIVQPAVVASSGGGNKKRNMMIGASIVAAAAVVGIIIGVTGGVVDDPPEVADGEDTELQSDDVAFVQDDEEPVEQEPVEEVVEEEATEEVVEEEATEEVVEEEATEEVVEEENVADQETALEAILTDTYSWGTETATKTILLQEALGLTADGSYGTGTRQAHLDALEERGLSIENLPQAPESTPIDAELDGGLNCNLRVDGPWVDPGMLWEQVVFYVNCSTPYTYIDFPQSLDWTIFMDACGFSLNGVSNPCTYVTGWDANVDDYQLQLNPSVDFTCGGACYPNRGDLLEWYFEVDFCFPHSDGITEFCSGPLSTAGSVIVPLNGSEPLQCSSSINGPWSDNELNWDGIAANMVCLTDIASVDFPNPLDISNFVWNCSFSINGNNYGCTNGNQSSWGISPGGQSIEFNNQLDFTCGGNCQPVSGDELSWNFSLDSIGIGYPPVTTFQGSTSVTGSVILP